MSDFDLNKYLGTWYELVHYPSWFQRNDNYNTKAVYTVENDVLKIVNSTISNGKELKSVGQAYYLGYNMLHVKFSFDEITKLENSGEIVGNGLIFEEHDRVPNYVIDRVWTNINGEYIFAVVTDAEYDALYVLSRYQRPSLVAYTEIMNYLVENYDRDRLVQTPHFF